MHIIELEGGPMNGRRIEFDNSPSDAYRLPAEEDEPEPPSRALYLRTLQVTWDGWPIYRYVPEAD